MSDLPIIPNESPVTTPAVAAVTYDALYVVGLKLSTGDEAGYVQPLEVTYRPYAYESKTLYPDATRDTKVTIGNIWPPALAYPLVGQVMGGLITVIPVIEQINKVKVSIASLQAQFDAATNRIAEIDVLLTTETDQPTLDGLAAEKVALADSLGGLNNLLGGGQAALAQLEAGLGA